MSDPVINTKITADTAQAEQAIRTVRRSVQDLSESTQSATSLMGTSWTQMATAFGAGSIVAKAIEGVISLIGQIPYAMVAAIKAIDSLKISTIQIAAAITNMQGPKNAAEHYAKASKYAETLAVKLQDVDAKSFANYQTLLAMTNTMTLQGVVLDVNNKKQVDSFTALSNAVAMYTAGQNQSVQAHQEIRALMSGETTQGSILAKQIDDQAKSQGLYKGGLKEIVAEGKKHGDLLERLTPFLVGINAASGDIAKTWEAVTSSAETSGNMIQRIGFAGLYESAVAFGAQAVTWLKAQAEVIGGGIARAWLSVKGIMETISLLFNSQDSSLRMITAAIKTVLGLVNEILYGWAFLLSTVLPTVAEKFNAIINIMSAVVHMGYAFGAAMIDSIVAVAKAFASFGMGMTKALTGDFAGMKQEFSKIFGADFKTLMEDNVLVMKGTVIAMKEEWGKLKDTSTFNNRFDAFIGKQKATETAEVPIIPPGKTAPEKAIDHSSEINTVISDYNRLQQETIKTDQSITELSRTLGILEFQNKKSADSFIATYNSSAQSRAEFDKQGITLAKINALYVELKNNAIIKADNKDYWDGVNARWREGKHEIDQVEQAIKRVFALGKNGEESPLYAFADDVHKATLAFTQAGDAFGVTAEAYVSAIEGAVSKLTGVTLKGLNSQNTDLAASQVGVDMSTGQVTDPYAQQQAMMEARYKKEFDLIDERTQKIKDAMQAESSSNAPNLTVYGKLQDQMLASSKNRTLHEKQQTIDQKKIDEESFRGRLSAASQYTNMAGQLFSELASTQDQSSRSGFESAKALSLAAAVMSTASAIMAQLTIPGPLGWAGAALAAATGVIQIAKIASTSFGSDGGVSAPAGSYAAAGGGSSSSGLNNLAVPLSSIQDSQTAESLAALTKSTDNASVVIGRLSKSIDSLNALFKEGGAGYSLAVNAPMSSTQLTPAISMMNSLYVGSGLKSFIDVGTALATLDVKKFLNAINPVNFISSTLGSIFGGKVTTTGAGISLGMENGQATGQNYSTSTKDGGWFHSDSHSTSYTNNSDLQVYVQELIKPYVSDIVRMSATLGTTVATDTFTAASVNIATAGRKPEDIAADVEKWATGVLQSMALTVDGLESVIGSYDDAYARLKALNDALVSTNDSFLLIGKTTLQGTLTNARAVETLQTLMGGIDAFTESVGDYFSNMFTDVQQDQMTAASDLQKVTNAFSEMHVSVPATNADFIRLVDSLDVTSASGATLFAALMQISPAFSEMTDLIEKQRQATADFNNDLTARTMELDGLTGSLDLFNLRIKQEEEMKQAVLDGMDTKALAIVQDGEWAEAVKSATNIVTDSITQLADAAKVSATDMIAAQTAIANSMKALKTGPLAMLSPEAAYIQARNTFANLAGKTDLVSLQKLPDAVNGFLEASKAFSPDLLSYQTDFEKAMEAMRVASGATGSTLPEIDAQITLLSQIKQSIDDGATATVMGLSSMLGPSSVLAGLIGTWNEATAAKLEADKITTAANLVAVAGQTYERAQTTYATAISGLPDQYRTSAIDAAAFGSKAAEAYAPVSSAYSAATSAGVTGIAAPTLAAISAADTNARMMNKASGIVAEITKWLTPVTSTNTTGGKTLVKPVVYYNPLYDLDPLGSGDGYIGASDLSLWQQISTGALKWSDIGLPAFAAGGNHSGGFRIVGEYGPELEATGASRIFNADQTRNIFQNGSADNRDMVAELRALREEVRELRNEQKAGHVAIAKNTGESAKQLRRWDGEGTPPVRVAA